MLLVKKQSYVSWVYNNKPLIGLVKDISDEMGDGHNKFIHPNVGFMKKTLLVCLIETPSLAMPTRMYRISKTWVIVQVCSHDNTHTTYDYVYE